MTKLEALAADYWIAHTDRIYKENLHVSTPVMEAFEAGFRNARRITLNILEDYGSSIPEGLVEEIVALGEEEE